MRNLSILLFILGLIFQTGCTSQARKTHLVFEKEDATYQELHTALEDLKPIGNEGSTSDQYKAANALRHIAKYMKDPARREMGARALVFLAYFNDDMNVEGSSLSRIEAILEDSHQDLALKVAIIDELEKIVTAKEGYYITKSSIFSNRVTRNFVYPKIDFREEALDFMMDWFEDLPEYLQYSMVQSFGRILANPTTCYELDEGTCDENDAEDQGDWKQKLRERIGDWLEKDSFSLMIKTSLVRLVETSAAAAAGQGNNPSRTLLADWAVEIDIPQQTRSIIETALNRLDNSYPDLSPLDSSTALVPFSPNADYRSLDSNDTPKFWYANADQILKGQLFRTDLGGKQAQYAAEKNASAFMQVPSEWILYDGYTDNPSSQELKEIIFGSAIRAFEKGFILSSTLDLQYSLDQMITAAAGQSDWALGRTLAIVSGLYPSLRQSQTNIDPLIESLTRHISRETSIHRKRLFINALIDGLPYFQDSIDFAVCKELRSTDLLTQHLSKVRAASLPGPIKPLTIADYRQQLLSTTAQNAADSLADEGGPYIRTFCGEDITGLKPKPPKLEEVIQETAAKKKEAAPSAGQAETNEASQ